MKLITTIILLALTLNCKKEADKKPVAAEKQPFYAVNLFSAGKVLLKNLDFKSGDILKEQEELKVEPKSVCDLQIYKEESVIRVYENTIFKLERSVLQEKTTLTKLVLNKGVALIRINKKLKSEERFEVFTPTFTTAVRGTSFKVQVDLDNAAKVSVYEGKVSLKIKLQESEETKPINEELEKNEITLETGKTLKVDQKTISNLIKSYKKDKPEATITQIQTKLITNIPAKEAKETEGELKELAPLEVQNFENNNSLKEGILKRIGKAEKELLSRMEKVEGKKKGYLTLTDGKEIHGILEQDGKLYKVETPMGIQEYTEKEVLEVNY